MPNDIAEMIEEETTAPVVVEEDAQTEEVTEEEVKADPADGLGDFTLADLEGLSQAEQDAVIAMQDAERKANEPVVLEEPKPVEVEKPAPAPAMKIDVDQDALKATLTGLTDKRDELYDKFNDGELSDEDFRAQNDALADQIADARAETKAIALIESQNKNNADAAWFAQIDTLFEKHPELGQDAHAAQFDQVLRLTETNPNNAGKTDAELINIATRSYFAMAEAGGNPVASAAAPAPNPVKEEKAKRPDLPPTLAKTPASDLNNQGDGTASLVDNAINKGNGTLEFSRMTEAQQNDYLNGRI